MTSDERALWRAGELECLMISCCSGAELQIRRKVASPGRADPFVVILRELYPTKSDLYERARALEAEYLASGDAAG